MRFDKTNDVLGTANRGNPAESGLCTLCRADCTGKCETWKSSLVGRKLLYPRDFGVVTAGANNTTHLGVSYNSLRIQGYAYGANGLPEGLTHNPDDCIFPNVDLSTEFGGKIKTKTRLPLMTGALGSTFIAAKYWDSFAVGAALVGIPIVIGENVVGVDRESIDHRAAGSRSRPELDRRIDIYLRYFDGYGAIIVQMNVEDTRNGVAEYVADKYGDKVHHRTEVGPGREGHRRRNPGHQPRLRPLPQGARLYRRSRTRRCRRSKEAFTNGAIKSFARHSRLGGTNLDTVDAGPGRFHEIRRLPAQVSASSASR